MLGAQQTPGLNSNLRAQIQAVGERAASQLIYSSTKPKELEELFKLDLPRQLAVEAGIRAARLYYERGDRMRAYRLIKKVDAQHPQHPRRNVSGPLLAEIGFSLAEDKRRYALFFRYSSLSPEVLEYFVLNYPSDPNGPQALWVLGERYEKNGRWRLAIEKHEDLILWFPTDARAPESEARIPHLRLAELESPEHDRGQLTRARKELEKWLVDHPGHPIEEEVRLDLTDAIRRLCDNDLVVARFYRRVKNFTGAEFHARRALAQAREGGDDKQIAEAEDLLARIVEWGDSAS